MMGGPFGGTSWFVARILLGSARKLIGSRKPGCSASELSGAGRSGTSTWTRSMGVRRKLPQDLESAVELCSMLAEKLGETPRINHRSFGVRDRSTSERISPGAAGKLVLPLRT
jgi:hypothetical protein